MFKYYFSIKYNIQNLKLSNPINYRTNGKTYHSSLDISLSIVFSPISPIFKVISFFLRFETFHSTDSPHCDMDHRHFLRIVSCFGTLLG
jgi:hypothetical protein